jgi:hypothetical protein
VRFPPFVIGVVVGIGKVNIGKDSSKFIAGYVNIALFIVTGKK